LVGYIFCIIDYHICRNIFGRIDIMYCRLSYVSRGVLPLKTLVLYIYQPRGTMQYNQQSYGHSILLTGRAGLAEPGAGMAAVRKASLAGRVGEKGNGHLQQLPPAWVLNMDRRRAVEGEREEAREGEREMRHRFGSKRKMRGNARLFWKPVGTRNFLTS
jgi:hypothetical protein